jgi:quinol-cytochrome oxidoreductase complex cytochrome b subunit
MTDFSFLLMTHVNQLDLTKKKKKKKKKNLCPLLSARLEDTHEFFNYYTYNLSFFLSLVLFFG